MVDIKELKAQVRSILLSLGKTATPHELRKAFYEIEGVLFDEILRTELKLSFQEFFHRIPDVARLVYANNQLFIQRVATEETSHMENLTINKYSKSYKGPKYVTKSGAIRGRAGTNPLSVQALPYANQPRKASVPPRNQHFHQPPVQRPPFQPQPRQSYNRPQVNATAAPRFCQPPQRFNTWLNTNFNPPVNNSNSANTTQQTFNENIPRTNAPVNDSNLAKTTQRTFNANENIPRTNYPENLPKNRPHESAAIKKCPELISERPTEILKVTRVFDEKAPSRKCSVESIKSTQVPELMPERPSEILKVTRVFDEKAPSRKCSVESIKSTQVPDKVETTICPPPVPPRILPTASSAKKIPLSIINTTPKQNVVEVPLKQEDSVAEMMGKLRLEESKQKATMLAEKYNAPSEKLKIDAKILEIAEESNENSKILTPDFLKKRVRSMRVFREALRQLSENEQKPRETTELVKGISKMLINLPEPIQNEIEPFFQIKIIDVLSPSKFTFQFSFNIIKQLNTSIGQFYSELNDIEKFRINDMIEGNIVVYRRGSSWCRAQIKTSNNENTEIQYIDHMKLSTDIVVPKNLFHIHQKFTTESPKSAVGSVYGIRPKNSKQWDLLSASKIIDLLNKSLLATVKRVENEVYSLCIYLDTDHRVRLSDVLVAENLAEIDPKSFDQEVVLRSLV